MNKKQKIHLTLEQHKKFENFVLGDDLDFYEEYVINLSDEDQHKFFIQNPKFMSEYPISHDKMYLLKDKTFRKILRKIKGYEGEKRC